jgi:hypothetical protein
MPNIENQTEQTDNLEAQGVEDSTKDLEKEMKDNEDYEREAAPDKMKPLEAKSVDSPKTKETKDELETQVNHEASIAKFTNHPKDYDFVKNNDRTHKIRNFSKDANAYKLAQEKEAGEIKDAKDVMKKANTELQTAKAEEREEAPDKIKPKEATLAANNESTDTLDSIEPEQEQLAIADTKHTEDVAALRKEEDDIDNETVEKLNTFAA